MTKKQFDQFKDEQTYIKHLITVKEEATNVCNRIDCTKYEIVKEDKHQILLLLSSLIEKAEARMLKI